MLRRKVFEDCKVVLAIDPALDMTEGEYAEYKKAWDPSKLKIKPGSQPTWFKIAQLSDKQKTACHRCEKLVDTADVAIRYGLKGVEGYVIEDAAGNVAELESPTRMPGELGDVIPSAWMDKARFLVEEKITLGAAILSFSEARPPLS